MSYKKIVESVQNAHLSEQKRKGVVVECRGIYAQYAHTNFKLYEGRDTDERNFGMIMCGKSRASRN